MRTNAEVGEEVRKERANPSFCIAIRRVYIHQANKAYACEQQVIEKSTSEYHILKQYLQTRRMPLRLLVRMTAILPYRVQPSKVEICCTPMTLFLFRQRRPW